MVERPLFVPIDKGSRLVDTVQIDFKWYPGFAASQKLKSVEAMHASAANKGFWPILEISSKSQREAGKRLSAFSLPYDVNGHVSTVEIVFQGSKVFSGGGPYNDLYLADSRTAKKDIRLRQSGRLTGFRLEGKNYPLTPATVFYDWLYISALYPHREWLERLKEFGGFTDIEFNPERSINCQARSIAVFVSLLRRKSLEKTMESFDAFRNVLQSSEI